MTQRLRKSVRHTHDGATWCDCRKLNSKPTDALKTFRGQLSDLTKQHSINYMRLFHYPALMKQGETIDDFCTDGDALYAALRVVEDALKVYEKTAARAKRKGKRAKLL